MKTGPSFNYLIGGHLCMLQPDSPKNRRDSEPKCITGSENGPLQFNQGQYLGSPTSIPDLSVL